MSLQFYIKDSNEAVRIEEKPFASGGEGALHTVISPVRFANHVAKIFHPHKRNDQRREDKINYLIEHIPDFEYSVGHDSIIWVEKSLYDEKNKFVGFIMPKASGEKLEILCAPRLPRHLSAEWKRFDHSNEESLKLRLKVCYNIATSIHQIHASGRYVMVDLKPDNILINVNGLISIVDTDSFEVIEDGEVIFPATVVTPEYSPAEYYEGVRPGETIIHESWDRFSLAVIFYRILFGIHPFAASARPPYDNFVTLGDKIHQGLYVQDPEKKDLFSIIPAPHRKFDKIDEELKKLFQSTFAIGHLEPKKRSSAEQWATTIISSPYLIVDRALPSRILNIEENIREDWYDTALNNAVIELKLNPPKPLMTDDSATNKNDFKVDVIISYLKFFGLIIGIVTLMVVFVSFFAGAQDFTFFPSYPYL
jgi:DNA-binding helix-hairpin-helix protein with protein kinase domain